MRRLCLLITLLALVGVLRAPRESVASAAASPAAASPASVCRTLGTDDRLREIPSSLVPMVSRLFGLEAMPAAEVQQSTVFRCFEGQVQVCNYGANLPCGKADTSRELPAATGWCTNNPDADFIPMYVTGHDTIYRWRCRHGKAVISAAIFTVDPRGFITRFWKKLPP